MQEQLEARLAQKRSEVKSVTLKLDAVQHKLSQRSTDAELANQQTTLTMTKAQHQITGYGHAVPSVAPSLYAPLTDLRPHITSMVPCLPFWPLSCNLQ